MCHFPPGGVRESGEEGWGGGREGYIFTKVSFRENTLSIVCVAVMRAATMQRFDSIEC